MWLNEWRMLCLLGIESMCEDDVDIGVVKARQGTLQPLNDMFLRQSPTHIR